MGSTRLARELVVDSVKARSGIEVASLSDVGCQRENNEDSYLYWEPESDEEFSRQGRLALVADGMGGYEGGQEASRLAAQTVREVYSQVAQDDPAGALLQAFAAAHARIREYGEEHLELRSMGTTCTAVAIRDRQLHFAHIGDSRLYLVRSTGITRLTRDHSYVGRLVESGIVSSEDAESHPQRHVLTAALGSGREVTTDVSQKALPLEIGDTLILCTDGLWGLVAEQELSNMARANTPAESCRLLVSLALERGAPDNITLQVLRVSK